jgi:hypothetical protein
VIARKDTCAENTTTYHNLQNLNLQNLNLKTKMSRQFLQQTITALKPDFNLELQTVSQSFSNRFFQNDNLVEILMAGYTMIILLLTVGTFTVFLLRVAGEPQVLILFGILVAR